MSINDMSCHIFPTPSPRFFFLVSKEESSSTILDSHISKHGISKAEPPLSLFSRNFEAKISTKKGSSLVCFRGSVLGASLCEEKSSCDSDQYVKDFERQLLYCPGSSFPSFYPEEKQLLPIAAQGIEPYEYKNVDAEPSDALSLAKKALFASKEAVSFAEESNMLGDEFIETGLDSMSSTVPLEIEIKVRSGRLQERRSKKRGVSKSKMIIQQAPSLKIVDMRRKLNEDYDPNNSLRLFLSRSNTRQLLTAKEEAKLFVLIQDLSRLEEVKRKLQSQFGREVTLIEWAEAVGLSCLVLQSKIYLGNSSREKMTCANFRLVVHVAKHYQGLGISLQDLLQEGSKGLMRSIDKFKPQPGCRFSTYAYWWIRQSIRKAIFQNSRTIRLPENVHSLLQQVKTAEKQLIQESYQPPTDEELASRMGITAEKLKSLLNSTRKPLSLQRQVWPDQDTTFEEITADTGAERPDECVAKQLMRQHVQNFLNILSSREKRIIQLRFGIGGGKRKSLEQIGTIFGISKERVRQIEGHSLHKLRMCSSSQGLEAYTDLLI